METNTSTLPLSETVVAADQAAVADAIRRASQASVPVYPIGGGTSLGYGAAASQPGLGLSLARLDRLVDYPARDLTITVEAGTTIATIARRLAAEGQRLPIDVPFPERATVGGAIAVNAGGPRRYRWGTIREYVIGLSAVDGGGMLFHGGGRVVKNAAGYDLCRLLTGSLGTLGVIVQATLMVKPLPETSALVACQVPDFDMAERLAAELIQTRTLPAAVELVVGPAWQQVPGLVPLESAAARLIVGLEGTLAEVEWMIGRLQEEWRAAGVAEPTTLAGSRADPLWQRLTEFRAAQADGPSLIVECTVLPAAVVPLVRRILQLDPAASVASHAGSGVIVARLPCQAGASPAELVARLRGELPAGGSLVVLGRPAGMPGGRELVWGGPRDGWAVMQAIKDRFDPQGILNRGRFVFADTRP